MTRHRPPTLELSELSDAYAVCRLPASAPLPEWAQAHTDDFISISRTADELSIVCGAELVPSNVRSESDWTCFKVAGPLDFDEIGIVASLAAPLATAGIGIFVVSTFDTDYLLVKSAARHRAVAALTDAGHSVAGAPGRVNSKNRTERIPS